MALLVNEDVDWHLLSCQTCLFSVESVYVQSGFSLVCIPSVEYVYLKKNVKVQGTSDFMSEDVKVYFQLRGVYYRLNLYTPN